MKETGVWHDLCVASIDGSPKTRPPSHGLCHKRRDSHPDEARSLRAEGPGGREQAEDAHSLAPGQWPGQCTIGSSQVPGTRKGLHQVCMSLPSGMTGHLGMPMKEAGGLSQPPRASITQTKQKTSTKQNKTRFPGWPQPPHNWRWLIWVI